MTPTFIVLASLALPVLSMPTTDRPAAQDETSLVSRRAVSPPPPEPNCAYDIIDGGPLSQAYHHWQVTDNLSCGTTKLKSHTFGIDSSVNIGAITAGVSESWTTGESYTCNENTDETVCVWVNMASTVYNVKTHDDDCHEPDVQAKFPNQDNAEGGSYCVTGSDCREMDANYWE